VQAVRDNSELAWKVNVDGAKNVVKVAKSFDVKPILFSSYYQIMNLNTEYGRQKKQMEADNQKDAVILRLGNVYGGTLFEKQHGVLWHFANDNPIVVDMNVSRDFVCIDAVLDACLKAQERKKGVVNVLSGTEIPIELLAKMFGAVRGVKVVRRIMEVDE